MNISNDEDITPTQFSGLLKLKRIPQPRYNENSAYWKYRKIIGFNGKCGRLTKTNIEIYAKAYEETFNTILRRNGRTKVPMCSRKEEKIFYLRLFEVTSLLTKTDSMDKRTKCCQNVTKYLTCVGPKCDHCKLCCENFNAAPNQGSLTALYHIIEKCEICKLLDIAVPLRMLLDQKLGQTDRSHAIQIFQRIRCFEKNNS